MTTEQTLTRLWIRRGELIARYALCMKERKLKSASLAFAALHEVTLKIIRIENRLDHRRAA